MTDWRHFAACVDVDPDLHFPVGTDGPALLQITEAKAVCFGCPVRALCLSWALTTGQDWGIWGGLTADERRDLKRWNRNVPAALRGTAGPSTDRPDVAA